MLMLHACRLREFIVVIILLGNVGPKVLVLHI